MSKPKTKAPDLPAIDAAAKLKGKSTFYLSAALSYPFSQEVLKGAQDARAVLSMTVVTADAAAGSSSASSYIVSQGAAAIILQGIDAYTIQASLADAKAARIAVVTVAALPPGPLSKEIADLGVSASVNFSIAEVGKVMAAYVAANVAPDAHVALSVARPFARMRSSRRNLPRSLSASVPDAR